MKKEQEIWFIQENNKRKSWVTFAGCLAIVLLNVIGQIPGLSILTFAITTFALVIAIVSLWCALEPYMGGVSEEKEFRRSS